MIKNKSIAFALAVALVAGCYTETATEEHALAPADGCGANRHRDDVQQTCKSVGVWEPSFMTTGARCDGHDRLICTYDSPHACRWSTTKDNNACKEDEPGCPAPPPMVFDSTVTVTKDLENGDKTCDPLQPDNSEALKRACGSLIQGSDLEPAKQSCLAKKHEQTRTVKCCVDTPSEPPLECLDGETLVCNLGGCVCIVQNPSL